MDSFTWVKSSYSSGSNDNCVEIARNIPGTVAVRDSKDPEGPALAFDAAAWRAFVESVRERR